MKEIDDYDLFEQDFEEFLRRGRETYAEEAQEIREGGEAA